MKWVWRFNALLLLVLIVEYPLIFFRDPNRLAPVIVLVGELLTGV